METEIGHSLASSYCPVTGGTSFGSESAAVTSCDAVCIRLLVRANTSPTRKHGDEPHAHYAAVPWRTTTNWFIFQIFENDRYEMGGKRCPGSASMVRGSGLSIRRSGDEIPCQRFLQGCQRPGFPHPPAHQIAVSVSFIHWVSDTSTPPRMEPLHDGERGQPRLCRFTHHAKVQCGPVIFVPGT